MSDYDLRYDSISIDGELLDHGYFPDDALDKCNGCGALQLKEDIRGLNRLCSECEDKLEECHKCGTSLFDADIRFMSHLCDDCEDEEEDDE